MKQTILVLSLATAALSSAAQSSTEYIPVLSTTPIINQQSYVVQRPVCNVVTEPVYQTQPMYQQYQNPDQTAPVVGMILGAAIGSMIPGGSQALNAFVGGTTGFMLGEGSRNTNVYVGQQTGVVGYRNFQNCYTTSETLYRDVIIGYNVTYTQNGITKTVTLPRNPGTHIRVVTSTSIQY
jgi:uncharacterized protein YcfJ